MRHSVKTNHLGRTSAHRKALLSNLAVSLIKEKRIETTLAKAKELRTFVEPLITRSKEDTTHSRRIVFSYLKDKEAVAELFREVAPKIADRPGGYTRILRTRSRAGDNADLCMIELVDFNELYTKTTKEAETKQTGKRRRRGSGKKSAEGKAAETQAQAQPKPEKPEQSPEENTGEKEQTPSNE
ncbi:MAG: 50S ribosomal protein L17 [Bacteroidales bacterium]|jgi:large subunit ribosomal protein L17|nr:50S ribosomal protein L17 [Bacteroidales bacterium]